MKKGKPENFLNIAKNQEFELITSYHFKNPISPKPIWNSQWSLFFFEKFRAIASLLILGPYFRFFFLKKRFLRKSSKLGHGNLVLITSTIQVELSKLNFNFDDIKTYFLQDLRDCRQTTFVKLNRFCSLSRKFLHSVSSFEGTS